MQAIEQYPNEENELELANEVVRSQKKYMLPLLYCNIDENDGNMVYIEALKQQLGYMLIPNERITTYISRQL